MPTRPRTRVLAHSIGEPLCYSLTLSFDAGRATRPLCGVMPGNKFELASEPAAAAFIAFAESNGDIVVLASPAGAIVYANGAAARILEFTHVGRPLPAELEALFAPDDRAYAREVIFATARREGHWTGDYRLRPNDDDANLSVRLNVFELNDAQGVSIGLALTGHPIATQRHAEQRLRTLIESGPALSHSLDYAQTLQNLAELVVRSLATFCEVDIFARAPGTDVRIQRVAACHVNRGRQAEIERLANFASASAHPGHPVARVLADGSSSLVEAIDDAWLTRATESSDHANALRALHATSLLCVPLVAGGRMLGALTCYLAAEPRERPARAHGYDAEDLFFLEELGRRAGTAIDNALTFGHERSIAASLQAASLPQQLPRARGLRVFADYRPGSEEATIGGDWYDAFVLEEERFVFTIGDVVGNGLRAGIVMTKLRQAMQAAAMVDPEPNVMLDVADRTLRLYDSDGFATSLAARYDPRARQLTFASAGHPGPLLRHPDGRVEDLTRTGLLLGMRHGSASETTTLDIPAGAALVFYTDGLIEATRDMAEGQRRLVDAVARADVRNATNPAATIVEDVLGGEHAGDDIAVLVVAFDHDPALNNS